MALIVFVYFQEVEHVACCVFCFFATSLFRTEPVADSVSSYSS